MVLPRHAQVFCNTSVWMVLPLVSALQNGKPFLAGTLLLTAVASMLHWRHLARTGQVDSVYHNADRLGVVLVLAQVHVGFWPLLALLFAAGAMLQRLPPRAHAGLPFCPERCHFWCHVLCRYAAFWACCLASGDIIITEQSCRVVFYSGLYALHIFFTLRRYERVWERPLVSV